MESSHTEISLQFSHSASKTFFSRLNPSNKTVDSLRWSKAYFWVCKKKFTFIFIFSFNLKTATSGYKTSCWGFFSFCVWKIKIYIDECLHYKDLIISRKIENCDFFRKKKVICVHVSLRLKNYTRLSVVFWKVKRNFP